MDMISRPSPTVLGDVLVDFAAVVAEHASVSEILHRLTGYCMDLLPVEGAGVLLRDGDDIARFATANDDLGAAIERLETELQEGPCIEAFETGTQIGVPDLVDAASRFPLFAPRAHVMGLRAIYAVPMHLRGKRLGVIDLVRSEPVHLEDIELAMAQMLADIAVAYVVNSRAYTAQTRLAEQLQMALDSRVLIEQAKGKLHAQLGVSTSDAFHLMRRHARSNHLELRRVAEAVLAGDLQLP